MRNSIFFNALLKQSYSFNNKHLVIQLRKNQRDFKQTQIMKTTPTLLFPYFPYIPYFPNFPPLPQFKIQHSIFDIQYSVSPSPLIPHPSAYTHSRFHASTHFINTLFLICTNRPTRHAVGRRASDMQTLAATVISLFPVYSLFPLFPLFPQFKIRYSKFNIQYSHFIRTHFRISTKAAPTCI